MFLAAMIGTSVAVAAMVGAFALREMNRLGYPLHLSMGAVIAGGALGMLIPPSLPMILFGVITFESIGRLFMAGMFPGILAGVLFCAWMVFAFRREEKGKVAPPATREEKLKALKEGYWGVLIPVIIIVMLYTGIATPTEIAAIGCLLSFIVAMFIYRTVSLKEFFPLMKEGLTAAVMVLFIIAGALVLASFVTQAGVSRAVADLFVGGGIPLWGFLAITMLILLGMGCLMEGAGLMLLMLPILHPTIEAYGFSLLVYAVIMVINIECAMLTPPVGLNLYAVDGIAKMQGLPSNMSIAIKGSLPFFVLYIITMIMVIVFPALATWLPTHTM
jgi:C4-dicarboxylate transporter DctM subunit